MHLPKARTWHVNVYCASPQNSKDANDNELVLKPILVLEEKALHSNRRHLHREE